MAKKSQAKSSETTEKKKKEYKLDLFKETLPALYQGDWDFYSRQPIEVQREISPLILMRWVSLADGFEEFAPPLVNEYVNTGFWQLSKHPELQWKMLSIVASSLSRRTPRHTWMMPKKKKSKTPIIDNYLLQMYPLISDDEINIIKGKLESENEVIRLAKDFGATDSEIKDVVKEYRANYGEKA